MRVMYEAGLFSPGIKVGNLLTVSGQIGIDPATKKLVDGGIAAQVKQTLDNVKDILRYATLQMQGDRHLF